MFPQAVDHGGGRLWRGEAAVRTQLPHWRCGARQVRPRHDRAAVRLARLPPA